MESQIPRNHGHIYGEDPHNVGLHSGVEGEDEHHYDKKYVIKKVKEKAKKIKDTIKKYGRGHDHDQEHCDDYNRHDDHDEDEEMMEDPEVHGAPIYESAAFRSGVPGQDVGLGAPRVNLERSTVMEEDRYPSRITDQSTKPFAAHEHEDKHVSVSPETYETKVTDPAAANLGHGQVENIGQPRVNMGRQKGLEDDPHVPRDPRRASSDPSNYQAKVTDPTGMANLGHGQAEDIGQPRVNMGRQTGLEEDPHAPRDPRRASSDPSNYQAKVTDPTGMGGEEAGINPILRSLGNMKLYEEPDSKPKLEPGQEQNLYTGSHDQFSPESLPTESTMTESFDAGKTESLSHNAPTQKPSNQSSYIGKISSATSAIADKAISTKNAVASKLGYGSDEDTGPQQGIGAVVKEKLAPVYEKVAEAGSATMSKVQGTGTEKESGEKRYDKGVSMKQYLVEKFRPGDEDQALSEVISDALHKRKEKPERESGEKEKPMGKVTESEEVARRLGTDGEDSSGGEGNNNAVISDNMSTATGMGVVDRLKDKVGSWFGKRGDQSQVLQASHGTSNGHGQDGAGQRRLQESATD